MFRISTRFRIVVGLTSILVSAMLMAVVLHVAPDTREAEIRLRAQLCEALAVNSSVLISREDIHRVQAILTVLKSRHSDIVSAGVRRSDGTLVVDVGDHAAAWETHQGQLSDDSQIYVPLRRGYEDWGGLELKFKPLRGNLWFEITHSGFTRLVVFVIGVCSLAWYWFLGRVLEQLNPSKAVPGRVRSALDTLAEGLLVLDRKGRIVLCNQSLAQTLGEDAEQLIGRAASKLPWIGADFITSSSREDSKSTTVAGFPWCQVLDRHVSTATATMRLRDAAGRERICQVNCAPVFGNSSQIRGVVCSFEDVTVLESQKVELAQASRAKSEFLANMSHEIRTPMNAILGFTEVLRRGMYDSPEQRGEYLDTIHASGKHLLHLINDILDLSKVESGRMELELVPCCLHEIMLDVVNVLRVKAEEKQLTLTTSTPGGLPEVITSDPGRLRQVVTNLIGNAIKFTDRGGVQLVARFEPGNAPLIALDIIDTGVGIPEKSLQKIFEPFTQADASVTRKFGGTGLGLTISKRFIEALGGTVSVTSTVNVGTTFTVTIPTGALDPSTRIIDISEVQARKRQGTRSSKRPHYQFPAARILLVDDGEANRQLIQLVLQREGFLVDLATNGVEAIEQATHKSYDVIFMDMQMPVLDGYAATSQLRAAGHREPIVALTANAMKGDEEKCRAAGCSGFLSKPVDLDELLNTLADLFGAGELSAEQTSAVMSPTDSAVSSSTTFDESQIAAATAAHSQSHEIDASASPTERLDAVLEMVADALAEDRREPLATTESTGNALATGGPLFEQPAANESQYQPCPTPEPQSAVYSSLPMDDAEFREIVSGFIDKLRREVDALNDACERADRQEIIRRAHWLKGAAGTMGFRDFTAPSTTILECVREGRSNELGPALDKINSLVTRVAVPELV